jgi:hypothetical protein
VCWAPSLFVCGRPTPPPPAPLETNQRQVSQISAITSRAGGAPLSIQHASQRRGCGCGPSLDLPSVVAREASWEHKVTVGGSTNADASCPPSTDPGDPASRRIHEPRHPARPQSHRPMPSRAQLDAMLIESRLHRTARSKEADLHGLSRFSECIRDRLRRLVLAIVEIENFPLFR